jgi:type IV secretion system protein VirD4
MSMEIGLAIAGGLVGLDIWHRTGVSWGAIKLTYAASVRGGRWLAWRLRRASETFGSARWLKAKEAARLGLLGGNGLIVGKMGRRLLRFADVEGSMIVFAPQGAGKGVGVVVPNLLTYRGSVICTDPKGENHAITARQRRTFGPVYCVNVGDPDRSHRFNPMDALSRHELKAVDDCRRLAELLMPKDARNEDDHWRKRSVSILTGFILHVLDTYGHDADRCNLAMVDALLAAPPAEFAETLKTMLASSQLVVRSVAARLQASLATEEGMNLLSNIAKGTEMWGEGSVLGRLGRRSDFNLEHDVVGRVGSLFISVPEDMQAVYAPFMRVMVGLGLHAVARVGKSGVGADRPLFMLDEAAALGAIPELEDGMGHLRAYARAVMIFQDMAQVRATYAKWESLISNASCQVFFGVNDESTADKVSRMLGDVTVETRTAGVNTGASTVLAHHQNSGVGEASRRLMQPSEVLRMDRDAVLVFLRGAPHPIKAARLRYYEERAFAGLWDRWRDGAAAVVPLMIEHKLLRLTQESLRIEVKRLCLEEESKQKANFQS